jgi:glutamate-ammonia-ligase adenylyltransferase
MRTNIASEIIEKSPDPARVKAWLEQWPAGGTGLGWKTLSAAQGRVLAALLGGSGGAGELLRAHPDWLPPLLEPGLLEHPRREEGLRREVEQWLGPLLQRGEDEAAFARLRQFKQREMLRIAARDLARLGDVFEITREISDVADVCLQAVYRLCQRRLVERLGCPYHLDAEEKWRETKFCVLGLGKLGRAGIELQFGRGCSICL